MIALLTRNPNWCVLFLSLRLRVTFCCDKKDRGVNIEIDLQNDFHHSTWTEVKQKNICISIFLFLSSHLYFKSRDDHDHDGITTAVVPASSSFGGSSVCVSFGVRNMPIDDTLTSTTAIVIFIRIILDTITRY